MMSIYPVRIKEWFVDPESVMHKDLPRLKELLEKNDYKCKMCGAR